MVDLGHLIWWDKYAGIFYKHRLKAKKNDEIHKNLTKTLWIYVFTYILKTKSPLKILDFIC